MFEKQMISRRGVRGLVGAFASCAVVGSFATAASVDAGASEVIDAGGKTLEFQRDVNVEISDLPFVYTDILPELESGCLQAQIDRTLRQSVNVDDVDENPSVSIDVDLEADPDDDPIEVQALAEFRIDFLFDSDCDPATVDSVSARVKSVCVHVRDIDDHQFIGFANPTSYALTADSNLEVENRDGFTTAFEPLGDGSEVSEESHWAQYKFARVESLRFRIGIDPGGDDDAFFALNFFCPDWTSEIVEDSPSSGRLPEYSRFLEVGESAETSLPNTR